jgi:hypothetical protein
MSRHTYDNASFRIDGKPFVGELTIEGANAKRFEDGAQVIVDNGHGTYTASVDVVIPGEDDLDEMAWRAIATPSAEASEVLDVLADALLERGSIRQVYEDTEEIPARDTFAEWMGMSARARSVREQAWEWAYERTQPPLIDRLRAIVRQLSPATVSDSTLEVAQPAETAEWYVAVRAAPLPRERRGFGNAPLGLRTKLKPWER